MQCNPLSSIGKVLRKLQRPRGEGEARRRSGPNLASKKKHEAKVGMRYNLEWEITLCTASLTRLSVAFSDSCRMFSLQPEPARIWVAFFACTARLKSRYRNRGRLQHGTGVAKAVLVAFGSLTVRKLELGCVCFAFLVMHGACPYSRREG
jgi:hypothetical protein